MRREIADENWDFRDGIDEAAKTEDFRLESEPAQKAKAGAKLTREQINALKGKRLTQLQAFYICGEIICTSKPLRAIAVKFGISTRQVRRIRNKVVAAIINRSIRIEYDRDGRLLYCFEGKSTKKGER